jgi:DNA-binding SARP family transcriptional activator/Tfp pilus assembly protein PilF
MEHVRFAVLGPVRAWRGDAEVKLGSPQQRAVLAMLLVHEGAQVTSEGLVDGVWGDRAPDTAFHVIRVYVHRLRQALGREEPGQIRSVGGGYALDVDAQLCDLTRFTQLLAEARQARADGNPAVATDLYAEGLELWTGPALAGVPGPYAATQRGRLKELRLSAQEEHLAAVMDLRRYDQAATELSALAEAHPLRERLRELQMLALYGAGRQAEALEAFGRTRLLLREELGVDPGPGLRAMHERILAMDPDLLEPAPAPAPAPAATPAAPTAAPAGPGTPVPAQLPADVAHFTGRAEHFAALTALAGRAGATVVVSAIGGSAGIGKTALTVHWAHRNAGLFPDGALYANLRGFDPTGSPMAAGAVVRGFIDALGVPAARVPSGPEAQAGLYRSLLSGKRMLILLDNARDADQVRPLLPGTPGCLVLITSRDQLAGLVAVDGAHSLTLDLLAPHEARDLLAGRLGDERADAEPGTVDELIELCARLPLALNITAARAAARPGFPLAVFAAELREARDRLAVLDAGDPAADVRTVFSWSYQTLGDAAARMFRLLGVHPGPDFTVPAAASLAAVDHDVARAAIDELTRAHLLIEHLPGRYTFHDLLRLYAAEQARTLDADEDRDQALRRVLDHYLHTAYSASLLLDPVRVPSDLAAPEPGVTLEALADSRQAWDWCAAEHQALLSAIAQAAAHGLDIHVCQFSWSLTIYLEQGGFWHDYRAIQTEAVAAARRLGDLAKMAGAHRRLAHAYVLTEDYPAAHTHLDQAAELYRQLGSPSDQARVHHTRRMLYDGQGLHREALEQAESALALYREAGDRFGQANTLNVIGWFHSQLGDHQRALTLCREALELCRSVQNSEPIQGRTWDSLGYVHHQLGQYRQAVEAYRRGLVILRETNHPYDEACSLTNLGDTYLAGGDHDAARTVWEQAQTIFEDLRRSEAEDVRRKLKGLT